MQQLKYENINKEIQDKESGKLKYSLLKYSLIEKFDPLLWNLMFEKMVANEDGAFEFIYAKGI